MLFKFIKRLFNSEQEALIGKIQQFTQYKDHKIVNCPKAENVLPLKLLSLVHIESNAKFKGTVGIIYVGEYNGKKISIKTILEKTKRNMIIDINTFKSIGGIAGILYSHIPSMINKLCDNISYEVDINREKYMCMQINEISIHIKEVDFIVPVPDLLSIKNILPYYFIDGISLFNAKKHLSQTIINDIGKKIALGFFKSLYDHNIIFGDMNPGNFLYNIDSNRITFIDYGCVFKLNTDERKILLEFHNAQKNKTKLINYLKKWNAPELLSINIYNNSQIFWKKNSIRTNTSFYDLLEIPDIAECKLPSELIIVIKSVYQLIELEKWLNSECVISDYLKKIK